MIDTKITSEVKDDKWDEILQNCLKLQAVEVDVGYFEGRTHKDSGIPLAELAILHERGSQEKNIPSRPFMTQAGATLLMDLRADRMHINQIVGRIVSGNDSVASIGAIGPFCVTTVRRAIEGQHFAPIQDWWKAEKQKLGRDTRILISTGEMMDGAEFRVEPATPISVD